MIRITNKRSYTISLDVNIFSASKTNNNIANIESFILQKQGSYKDLKDEDYQASKYNLDKLKDKGLINIEFIQDDYIGTKGEVNLLISQSGNGDMERSVYDTNLNNIVDKSEGLDDGIGHTADANEVRSHIDNEFKHREIFDNETSNEVLWSSQKISNDLNLKANTSHTQVSETITNFNETVSNNSDVISNKEHSTKTNNPHSVGLEQARIQNPKISGDIDANGNTFKNIKSPVDGNDAANKDFVINVAGTGLNPQVQVLDRLTTPPGSPDTGDRYMIISPATGDWLNQEDDLVEWNGATWIIESPSENWIVNVLSNSITYTYNLIKGWVVFSNAGSHSSLTDLLNDDHSQYHNDVRGDARYYLKTELNSGSLDVRYRTHAEISSLLAGKANITHDHTVSNISDFENGVNSASDVVENTNYRHDQNSDLVLDQGGANEVSAITINSHLANVGKHREINDSSTSTLSLWSSDKVSKEIEANRSTFVINSPLHEIPIGVYILPIYWDNDNTQWEAANPINEFSCATHCIVAAIDANNFLASSVGRVYADSHGLSTGFYFSGKTPGTLVQTPPSDTFSNPILIITESDYINVVQWRPELTVPIYFSFNADGNQEITGNSSFQIVDFPTKSNDQGIGNPNVTTGSSWHFKAPKTAIYQFNLHIYANSPSGAASKDFIQVASFVDNVQRAILWENNIRREDNLMISIGSSTAMTKDEILDIRINITGLDRTIDTDSGLDGHLVGRVESQITGF